VSNVLPLQQGVIYGPVNSKRLGRSLGINLFPTTRKVCSFDCIYCHYGWTQEKTSEPDRAGLPTVDQVIFALETALKSDLQFDYLTFSGNGEPMLHPNFAEIVKRIKALRDKLRPTVPIALLSNSSCLIQSLDIDTLSKIDLRIFKLDTADQTAFEMINNAVSAIKIKDIIIALEKLSAVLPIIIQTVFFDGLVNNYQGVVFNHWLAAIKKIKPQKIQIYSTDRPVASSKVKMISNEKLKGLTQTIIDKTGIPTTAYF
jgi:wyosine [tRNA(Phe)-imidazoG37] synthetase (radical SAM superfamily)